VWPMVGITPTTLRQALTLLCQTLAVSRLSREFLARAARGTHAARARIEGRVIPPRRSVGGRRTGGSPPTCARWRAPCEQCRQALSPIARGVAETLKTTRTCGSSTSTRRTRARMIARCSAWLVVSSPVRTCAANAFSRPTACRSSTAATRAACRWATCSSNSVTRCRSRVNRDANSSFVSSPSA